VALLAFCASLIARQVAHHGFDLSGDEFIAAFQAKIFLEGRILAPLDPAGLEMARALQPVFVFTDAEHGLWGSHYRPVFAAMRAVAMALGADAALNPAMAALAAAATYRVIKALHPDRPDAALVGALVLAVSPQVIATAASGFSFPAHLAFNMCWLACFLRGGARGHLAAIVIGVAALGLHQVHVHALFAAPFVAALLLGAFPGRGWALAYGAAYVPAVAAWIIWPELAVWLQTGDAGAVPLSLWQAHYFSSFGGAGGDSGLTVTPITPDGLPAGPLMAINLARLAAWLSPALLALFLMGAGGWRRLATAERVCLLSIALSIGFRWVFVPDQMHGWGYRHLHPWIGLMAVVAAAGYARPPAAVDVRRLGGFVAALIAVSALALAPLKLWQVERKVGPRAAGQAYLSALDVDVAVLDARLVWFGDDLVRNDPFLRNRPLLLLRRALPATWPDAPRFSGSVATGLEGDLRALGVSAGGMLEPSP
jgi:hypothetical protein